jgi:DNA-directed RNA polymerase specialized sigma24 family protein
MTQPLTDHDLDILRWKGLACKIAGRLSRRFGVDLDLLESTCLRAIGIGLQRYDETKGLPILIWLAFVTRRFAMGDVYKELRRAKRYKTCSLDSMLSGDDGSPESLDPPAREEPERWERADWEKVLSHLPVDKRMAVKRWCEGESSSVIAESMGWANIHSTNTRIMQQITALRGSIKPGEM